MNNGNSYNNPFANPLRTSTSASVNKIGGTTTLQQMSGFLTNWKIWMGILFLLLLCTIGYYTYKRYAENKTSFHANRENIPADLQDSDKTATLMLFYVDWCPHCKTAKPEWESLKAEYDGKSINGYTVYFEEYNCTNETAETSQLMDKYNIEGYPTIKLSKDNQIIEYDAKPTKVTLDQFLHTVL
jgi:thiol-disulfide isomerase/thioredoxin